MEIFKQGNYLCTHALSSLSKMYDSMKQSLNTRGKHISSPSTKTKERNPSVATTMAFHMRYLDTFWEY